MANKFDAELTDLAEFLDTEGLKVTTEIVVYWRQRQDNLTADDLSSLLDLSTPQIPLRERIHEDVTDFIRDVLMSVWSKGWAKGGGDPLSRRYGVFAASRSEALEEAWRRNYILSLQEAAKYLNTLAEEHSLEEHQGVYEPETLRYVYGLREQEALAVLNYQFNLLSKSLFARALEYARSMLSRRAATIAESELAESYAAGAEDKAIRENGPINFKKVWRVDPLSANICARCKSMNGEVRAPGEQFTHGVQHEPLHNRCRCKVEYIEQD